MIDQLQNTASRAGTRLREATDRILDRLRFDHQYSRGSWATVVVMTFLVSYYGAWVLADLGFRWTAFVALLGLNGYVFTRYPSSRAILARACYHGAVFTLLIPFVIWVVYLQSPSGLLRPFSLILTPGDVIFFFAFALVAGLLAGIGRVIGRKQTKA